LTTSASEGEGKRECICSWGGWLEDWDWLGKGHVMSWDRSGLHSLILL